MIVPALLTDKKEDLIKMVDSCSEFTDYVQVDIMDGNFVPSKSITILDLDSLKLSTKFEAHLMVVDPVAWITPFKIIGAEKIIYHFEIAIDHHDVISKIKKQGLSAGIAVNPSTKISEFESLVSHVDVVLFMSVNPGFYGASFIPEVLAKIRAFKDVYPDKIAGIDGGVKLDNIIDIKASGADYICVGSAILKAGDPKKAYNELIDLLNE